LGFARRSASQTAAISASGASIISLEEDDAKPPADVDTTPIAPSSNVVASWADSGKFKLSAVSADDAPNPSTFGAIETRTS
jgi:hypothetical protein